MLSQIPDTSSFPRTGTASPATRAVARQSGKLSNPAFPRVATDVTSHGRKPSISQVVMNTETKMTAYTT